ncbi:MAG: hypothetical protein P1U63_11275 [Coxiellaceae bacterium]|nr:hypothetical protein [Coxiellaceae bacterium]
MRLPKIHPDAVKFGLITIAVLRMAGADSYFYSERTSVLKQGTGFALLNKMACYLLLPLALIYALSFVFERKEKAHTTAVVTTPSPPPVLQHIRSDSTRLALYDALPEDQRADIIDIIRKDLARQQQTQLRVKQTHAITFLTMSFCSAILPLAISPLVSDEAADSYERWFSLVPIMLIPMNILSRGIAEAIHHNDLGIQLRATHLIPTAAALTKLGPLIIFKSLVLAAPELTKGLSDTLGTTGMFGFTAALPVVLGLTRMTKVAHITQVIPWLRDNKAKVLTIASVNFLVDWFVSCAPHYLADQNHLDTASRIADTSLTITGQMALTTFSTGMALLLYKVGECLCGKTQKTPQPKVHMNPAYIPEVSSSTPAPVGSRCPRVTAAEEGMDKPESKQAERRVSIC